MQHFRAFLALAFAAGLTLTSTAEAGLTRLEISKREIVAGGMAFGTAGAYEKLTGRAWFEADPLSSATPRCSTSTACRLTAEAQSSFPPMW
jgi:hypothetical protein